MVGLEEVKKENENFALQKQRTRQIRSATFNVNMYSELECVTKFWFKNQDSRVIYTAVDRHPGNIARGGYTIDRSTAYSSARSLV